ncbi:MFS transporter [bacterium]|nr:MFS transporter [bacterium]
MVPKLSRDLKLIIAIQGLRKVSDLFFGTFLISFIMQTTTHEILSIGMYELFTNVVLMAGFVMVGAWAKRHNKIAVLVWNQIVKIGLLAAIMVLGDNAVQYTVSLGIAWGLVSALYWIPMHTMIGERVVAAQMPRFVGLKTTVQNLAKILSPVVLGIFITAGSYPQMAGALIGVSVLELIIIMGWRPSYHRSQQPLELIGFIRCLRRFPVIKKLFLVEILRGFSTSGALSTIITMYTVYMFHTDLKLGALGTLFAICSMITTWGFSRIARATSFSKMLSVCAAAIFVGMGLFVGHTTPMTFLIYNFMYATAICLLEQICETNTYTLSKSPCVDRDHQTEYFIARDGALFIGRWASYVGMLYIGVFGDASWLRYYLILMMVAIVAAARCAMGIAPHMRRHA